MIAIRWALVMRGMRMPLLVELTSSSDEESGIALFLLIPTCAMIPFISDIKKHSPRILNRRCFMQYDLSIKSLRNKGSCQSHEHATRSVRLPGSSFIDCFCDRMHLPSIFKPLTIENIMGKQNGQVKMLLLFGKHGLEACANLECCTYFLPNQ